MLNQKTWNIRDAPEESLKRIIEKKYKEIEADFKMLKKLNNIEDAKIMIEEIWRAKEFAKQIELELTRREFNNGASE